MVTPESFILKLGTRDYVEEITYCTIFDVDRSSGGFSPNRWNITLLWLFSCPVLSFVFSFQRPARTARRIIMLCGSNDVVPPKDVPFAGLGRWVTSLEGVPQKSPKRGVNRRFQAKLPKSKNCDISETIHPISPRPPMVRFTRNLVRRCKMRCRWRLIGQS